MAASACKDEVPTGGAASAPSDGKSADGKAGAFDATAKPATPLDPPSTAEAIVGDAVVRSGAKLYFAPTGDVGFELPPLSAAPGMPVHVVGEEGGRLVVETLAREPAEPHCAATLDGIADFRLRFHLAKDDLSPVLTADLEHAFADGTKLRLARGVPIPAGASEIVVRGTKVRVPVPAERIGRSYKPGASFPEDGAEGVLPQMDGQALTYDGQTLVEDGLYTGNRGSLQRYATTERASDALVTVRNACLEVTALVSLDRLRAPAPKSGLYAMKGPRDAIPEMARNFDPDAMARDAGILGLLAQSESDEDVWGGLTGTEIGEAYGKGGLGLVGTGRGATIHRVKVGAAISWSDGRPAGQVGTHHDFPSAPRDEGGRKCFDVPLLSGQPASLVLCFAPVDVEETADTGEGTIGLGNVGLIGKADVGTGFSYGTVTGSRSGKVPSVRQAAAEVKGSLDKDIIRRIVRAHINEVRYCYNQGLLKDPTLSGRVKITFTIGSAGSVTDATLDESTVSDATVGTCIAKAIKRWKFPKPDGGGNVVVTYPFLLEPG